MVPRRAHPRALSPRDAPLPLIPLRAEGIDPSQRCSVGVRSLGGRIQRAWQSPATKWVLVFACLSAVTLWLWRVPPAGTATANLGTWGEWIAGLGSVSAAVVALSAIVIQRHAEDIGGRTAVAAWMDVEVDPDRGQPYWTVKVRNDTGLPIFEWGITSSTSSVHLCSRENGPIVPEMSRYLLAAEEPPDQARAVALVLEFKDRLGKLWQRDASGEVRTLRTLAPCPNRGNSSG